MNQNVTYNPDVGQTNQSVLAYTTSGNNQGLFVKNDIFYGLNSQERADAEVMLKMLSDDIKNHVKKRIRGNSNVRY